MMQVTVKDKTIVATNSRVELITTEKTKTVVVHKDEYDVVKKGEYIPYSLQEHITELESATKLTTTDNGAITGFKNVDGSNVQEDFTLNVDSFKLVEGDTQFSKKTPFISHTGKVYLSDEITISNKNFAVGEKPLVFKGEYASFETLPTTGLYDGYEAYVVNQGYYVYTDGVWYLRVGTTYLTILQSSAGTVFRLGEAKSTTIRAFVFSNGTNITDTIAESNFCWRRVSDNFTQDNIWNLNHRAGYKSIEVTINDVFNKATFFCDIMFN